jgi:hypothetical protein
MPAPAVDLSTLRPDRPSHLGEWLNVGPEPDAKKPRG